MNRLAAWPSELTALMLNIFWRVSLGEFARARVQLVRTAVSAGALLVRRALAAGVSRCDSPDAAHRVSHSRVTCPSWCRAKASRRAQVLLGPASRLARISSVAVGEASGQRGVRSPATWRRRGRVHGRRDLELDPQSCGRETRVRSVKTIQRVCL